jgi:monoamine oxidase
MEDNAGVWRLSRRQFVVGATALGLVPASLTAACPAPGEPPLPGVPRVGVVGAGIAGLHCAALLRGAGIDVRVFDAQTRVGGRMLTDRTTFGAQSGQHCELGGELVDTEHETMFDLAEAFGLTMLDFKTDDPALETLVAHFGGERFGVADLVAAWGPVATRLQADVTAADGDDTAFAALDALSIVDWLDMLEADGVLQAGSVMRQLLEVAYTIEYGLEPGEQSALNLVYLAGTDPDSVALFGASDELFHVEGGNDAITTGLAGLLPGAITLGARLTRITGQADGTVALRFATDGGDLDEVFDRVVLALPFTLLREVERVDVELSADKAAAIDEIGYGTNSKLMLGFSSKVWRTDHGSNGETFTDVGYHLWADALRDALLASYERWQRRQPPGP